jgi:Catalase
MGFFDRLFGAKPTISARPNSISLNHDQEIRVVPSELASDLLDVLDQLSGGVHPGFRPVHARGVMYSGTFTPSADAAKLTRAPHAVSSSTPVTVRFSVSAGIPTIADNHCCAG